MANTAAVSYEQMLNWLRLIDESLIESRGYLTELDAAIGDGDHGTNLTRGAAASSSKVDAEQPEYLDELFKLVGMTLVGTVGGASGPLYGTFFLRFATSAGHRQELTPEQFADALDAGLAGIVTADLVARKGRASYLGDRSVGHIDPGAASTALMFEALAQALA
jgi:dihydroxyacetone kinase-like protein